jgi:GH24 family phage-related lysozyme (muramidase)
MIGTISDAAFNLIVTCEDGGPAYYREHYMNWERPPGASGPTCGIGYDCGYVSPGELRLDWEDIVPADVIENMVKGCGLRGELAQVFVNKHKYDITISWDQAIKEFREREVAKWIGRVRGVLVNADLLSPDSLGALVSLCYNRGTGGFRDPSPRYSEMRAIRQHMLAQNFWRIPNDIRSMKRLWPGVPGLQHRRELEAELFQKGLPA